MSHPKRSHKDHSPQGRGKPRLDRVGGKRLPAKSSSARRENASNSVRLNKYLADHGIASRRGCDTLIEEGKVTVDGEPVSLLGTKIDPHTQRVEIDGVVLKPEGTERRYYLLNKPAGVVCTNARQETRPKAIDLITDRERGRVYTVGRLDEESKGLILITNDGDFAQRVAHPRHGVTKTYVVKVRGKIDDEHVQKIREGVYLSEGRTSGARVLVLRRTHDYSTLAVTLTEGLNREVRRIFARVGFKVVDLKRTRIGALDDRGLRIGRWRALSAPEVEALLNPEPDVQPTRTLRSTRAVASRGGRRSDGARSTRSYGAGRDSRTTGSGRDSRTNGSGRDSRTIGSGRFSRTNGSGRDSRTNGSGRDSRTNGSGRDSRTNGPARDSRTNGAARGGRTRGAARSNEGAAWGSRSSGATQSGGRTRSTKTQSSGRPARKPQRGASQPGGRGRGRGQR